MISIPYKTMADGEVATARLIMQKYTIEVVHGYGVLIYILSWHSDFIKSLFSLPFYNLVLKEMMV
jgi:hypothetical protein